MPLRVPASNCAASESDPASRSSAVRTVRYTELNTLSAIPVPGATAPCSASLIETRAADTAANSSVTRPAMYAKLPYDCEYLFCSPVASAMTPSTLVVTSPWVGELGFCRSRLQAPSAMAAAATIALGACNLDLQNPNSPTQGEVTTSVDGVIALATGLQNRYSQSYGNFAYMAGLVTDEFAAVSAALVSISDAEQGAVAPGTGIADNVFNSVYRTVRTADDLLAGSDSLAAQFEAGTRSGIRALAFALKADALGEALMSYQ